MCTLAVAFRARSDLALAVTANRDELYARPSLPPRYSLPEGDAPAVVMPRDEQEGGTWLGLNARGLFVGITNRAGVERDPMRRSRGILVVDCLKASSARELHTFLATLPPSRHNGFHLLYADREHAFVTWSDGQQVTQLELPAGVHAITERSFGAGVLDRAGAVQERVRAIVEREPPTLELLRDQVKQHGPPGAPLEEACVHGEAFGYGTRSSLQLLIPSSGAPSGQWTEGPPCTAPASDLGELLRQLLPPAT